MKRLIVCGALLFSGFSGLVTGCGSRSSDDLYLPEVTAGEAPFSRSGGGGALVGTAGSDFGAGDSGLAGGGASSSGATNAGAFSSAGAAGSVAASGSSGFVSFGGSIGIAGAAGFAHGGAVIGGASGAAVGGASGGFTDAGAPNEGGGAGISAAGSGGASIAGSGGLDTGGAAGTADAGGSGFSGSSGAGTAGAAGGNSLSCPIVAPQNNNLCSDASLTCSYVGERCRCRQMGPNTAWRCTGSGDACPSTHPVAAASCTGNLQCPYPGGDQCNCQNGKWNCFSPGCPASKPAPGSSCGAVAGQCTFGTAGACVCVGGGWFCN